MKKEAEIRQLYEYCKIRLFWAAEEKSSGLDNDPDLDLLLLSLADSLDILEWVLDLQSQCRLLLYPGDKPVH